MPSSVLDRRDLILAVSSYFAVLAQSAPHEDGDSWWNPGMHKTHFGINPSFANWTSRLPLFSDPIRRGKSFEVFGPDGTPTGEQSPVGSDGWPIEDGRWHGVRLFGDMDGTMPAIAAPTGSNIRLRVNSGMSAFACWKGGAPDPMSKLKPSLGGWHEPSLEALAYFKPKVLRTLDYSYQARKSRRPDWSKPVLPGDPLQGEEMAIELQCCLANVLSCALWWNAPPRFELSVPAYEAELEEMLIVIRDNADKPPILEYGNELWNDGFPVKNWLDQLDAESEASWHVFAAKEIAILKRVADRVFGEPGPLGAKPYYLFVGGHIGNPDTLERILSVLSFAPDIAGPAVYARPRDADEDRWARSTIAPTQDELRISVMSRLPEFRTKLDAHRNILKAHNVPYFACYEVGQDMHARGPAFKQAALQAQREPWMGDLYRELRKLLDGAGVDLACWYSAASAQTPDRAFGLLEGTLDKKTPLPKAMAARGD